jgi:Protein of unknown function (DUF3592)
MNEGSNWLWIVFLALGGVVFVSICRLVDLVRYRWSGIRVSGKVIGLARESTMDDEGWVYAPIVEYCVDEEVLSIKPPIAMWPALYRVSQEVSVYYFDGSPANARVVTAGEFGKWTVVIVSCLLFLALLVHASGSPRS